MDWKDGKWFLAGGFFLVNCIACSQAAVILGSMVGQALGVAFGALTAICFTRFGEIRGRDELLGEFDHERAMKALKELRGRLRR